MTSSSPAGHDELPALHETPVAPAFYVVSLRKLAILYLATFTLYTFYWFYKHWDRYKGRHPEASRFGTTVWLVPRAVFPMFFTHALFFKIRAAGRHLPDAARWPAGWYATFAVAWMVFAEVADRLVGGTAGDLVSIAAVFPLLWPLLAAQRMANRACGDAQGASNAALSTANKAWIAIGAIAWVVAIAGLFMPGADA